MLFACGPDCGIQLVRAKPWRKLSPANIPPRAAEQCPEIPDVPGLCGLAERLTWSPQEDTAKCFSPKIPALSDRGFAWDFCRDGSLSSLSSLGLPLK